jgi:hypothetical protein
MWEILLSNIELSANDGDYGNTKWRDGRLRRCTCIQEMQWFVFLGETMKLSVDSMPVSIFAGNDIGGIEVKVPAITSASQEDGMNLGQKTDP